MKKSYPPLTTSRSKNDDSFVIIPTDDLSRLIENWLLSGDIAQHSENTTASRRERTGKLLWFLKAKNHDGCGLATLRAFFSYLNHGHKEKGGRWGNDKQNKSLSSGRVKSYYSTLRAFFNWCVSEGEIPASPMERIPAPIDRPDQVQPFTVEQVKALLKATRQTTNPVRDEAMIVTMLDTGIRVSELCDLLNKDVNLGGCLLIIREGKGGKLRQVPFSNDTRRALYNWQKERGDVDPDAPLFISGRGTRAGEHMPRHGVLQFIRRLGKQAGITGARLSPHTFRHTFAIFFLRNGGDIFSLQTMLGHTDLQMVRRYAAIAQADVERQHRRFSPVANLKRG